MASTDSTPTLLDPTTCVRKGLCPVTSIRKQNESDIPPESHSLYFELHGSGANKVVFIMGMNSSMFAWKPQVDYFGKHGGYSALVFDNRGMGNSGTPKGPYTTSGMAEDVIVLLDYVGWTGPRAVHVVGASLGGMIAQGESRSRKTQLAIRVPERIISLSLIVTTPGGSLWGNLPPWKGLSSLARLMTITDQIKKIPIVLDMLFPPQWLDEKAEEDAQGRTNRQVQSEHFARRIAIMPPQTLVGTLSQMWAGWTHRVSHEQLKQIAQSVPKLLILTGDEDHMVSPAGSERLWVGLTGWMDEGKDGAAQTHRRSKRNVDFWKLENSGHGVPAQRAREVNAVLEKMFREGNEVVVQADSRTE